MIDPAPTSKIDPAHARGVLAEIGPMTAGRPDFVVLEFSNTNYQLHLRPTADIDTPVGKRIIGTIEVPARKIDVVGTGGRYVEPVYGSPRRVQGTIVALTERAIVVNAGMPIHCIPTERDQQAQDFEVGQFVSFDVLPGASFTPA